MGSANPLTFGRFHLHRFQTLASTQVEARDRHYLPGDIVMADTQTTAYGRRGRVWQAPPGNLYCTIIEQWTGYEQLGWLGYAVGLGLYDAIGTLMQQQDKLRLKWPNDLLIDGMKMSGILLEVYDDYLLVGIGMNISTIPDTDQPVTALNEHLINIAKPVDIMQAFLPRYDFWCREAEQKGFAALREAWLSRAAFVGETIAARLADGTVLTGIFEDLNPEGALVLQDESGHNNIVTAADIYLRKDQDQR